jgi:hypothetical protein
MVILRRNVAVAGLFILVFPMRGIFSSLRIGESIEDLLQFAAIQPDTPAFLAKINFNVLPVSQNQIDITVWTFHVLLHLLSLNE